MKVFIGAIIVLVVVAAGFGVYYSIDNRESTDGNLNIESENETNSNTEDDLEALIESETSNDTEIEISEKNTKKSNGAYIEYSANALTEDTNVIFFHASWCPTCRQLDENINESGVSAGLTILKADYDDETALKQKYGVTTQHTLVQVDSKGNLIKKWSGSYSVDEILEEI